MATVSEIADYIARLRGEFGDAAVREQLKAEGCETQQIDEAFKLLEKRESAESREFTAGVQVFFVVAVFAVGGIVAAMILSKPSVKRESFDLRSDLVGVRSVAADAPAARTDTEPAPPVSSAAGGAQADLGALRLAASEFFAAHEGAWPPSLGALVGGKLAKMPSLSVSAHAATTDVELYDASACAGKSIDPAKARDTGKWGYVSDAAAPCAGWVFVDCTHTDDSGQSRATW